jgi:hypothetical protein
LLRRAEKPSEHEPRGDIVLGGLRISETAQEVWLDGKSVQLTTQEFELILLLGRRAGQVLSREEIFRNVRGIDYNGLDRSIDGRISKLRNQGRRPRRPGSKPSGARATCSCRMPGAPSKPSGGPGGGGSCSAPIACGRAARGGNGARCDRVPRVAVAERGRFGSNGGRF